MRHVFVPSAMVLSLLASPACSKQPYTAYDADAKVIGEVIRWDDRIPNLPLNAYVRYPVAGGDHVALIVAPGSIVGVQQPGGSSALFTTPDCSGNDMFVVVTWPPLMKRYAMVLPVGNPSTVNIAPTGAWLFITDSLPQRANPGGTVFHSQWTESGNCSPYPPPGYTIQGNPFGGYWMHRVEDLYPKFKRPYYFQ